MNTKLFAISVLAASFLSACGGGSSSPSAATPPVSTTPGVTPANLQTNVPAPTYVAGSPELEAYTEFSGFRRMMGLGPVAQSPKADTAAKNHSNYVVLNQNMTHFEDATKPGYTGVSPADRMLFAQYTGNPGLEVIGVGLGKLGIKGLMNTLYHRDGLTAQALTEVGISSNGGWGYPLVMNFGRVGLGQNNASDFTTTYPVANQTDLPLTMLMETPNPFPDLALTFDVYSKNTSSPISVYSEQNTTLSVSSFSVTEEGQTLPLDVRLFTRQNDVNKMVPNYAAHIVGKAPFKENTKYSVSFSGNVNGVAIVKNWSFTTGTSINIGGGANK